ncbi:MAG: exo-alpha-sialidase, partial [Gemmatimonadetes bacterium]|nr:exo-alpha-sialidase [Gemmatimonadota bacterium]
MNTHPTTPQILSVEKIWDRGPHNAFTDLIRFADRWWCTFREAQDHGPSIGT